MWKAIESFNQGMKVSDLVCEVEWVSREKAKTSILIASLSKRPEGSGK